MFDVPVKTNAAFVKIIYVRVLKIMKTICVLAKW
jgi:hypothetical protein